MPVHHHNENGGAKENHSPSAQLKAAAEILEKAAANRALLAGLPEQERMRLLKAAGEIYCPDVNARRRLVKAKVRQRKAEKIQRDQSKLNKTGIRKLRREKIFTTPNLTPLIEFQQREVEDDPDFREVVEPQNCYICKQDYTTIHHFYDQLCPVCGELNFRKRTESADLRGRVALLTGGRVKIGYQAGIKLLRAGAQLIVSTRFPRDAATRYAAEPDFAEWGRRLEIFGLDLRHTPSVEAFCRHLLATQLRLDFIINNACQTVRRPPDFYQHMMKRENGSLHDLPPEARRLLGAYEGLRGYHLLPESSQNFRRDELCESPSHQYGTGVTRPSDLLAGLTHAAALSQVPLAELAASRSLRCARPSSSAFPAKPTRILPNCSTGLMRPNSTRVGCFKYEPVAGAAANALENAVPGDDQAATLSGADGAAAEDFNAPPEAQGWHQAAGHHRRSWADRGQAPARNPTRPILMRSMRGNSPGPALAEIVTAKIERSDAYDLHGSVAGF